MAIPSVCKIFFENNRTIKTQFLTVLLDKGNGGEIRKKKNIKFHVTISRPTENREYVLRTPHSTKQEIANDNGEPREECPWRSPFPPTLLPSYYVFPVQISLFLPQVSRSSITHILVSMRPSTRGWKTYQKSRPHKGMLVYLPATGSNSSAFVAD